MGLIAVFGVAVAAVAAASRSQPAVAGWTPPVLAYALCLVPGAVAAVRWPVRRLRPLHSFPGRTLKIRGADVEVLRLAVMGALVVLAACLVFGTLTKGQEIWRGVAAAALLAVPPLSLLWPHPAAVRVSVCLVGLSLVAVAPPLEDEPLALVLVVAGSIVALVATSHLTLDALPRLGQVKPGRARRAAASAAGVVAVAVVAGILLSSLLPPGLSFATAGPEGDGRGGGDLFGNFGWGFGRGPGKKPTTQVIAHQDRLDASGDQGEPARSGSGGRKPSRDVVLRVVSEEPDVWRTQTFDVWDGRGWTASTVLGAELAADGGSVQTFDGIPRPGAQELHQRFRVEARVMDVLAAAPDPEWVADDVDLRVSRLGVIQPDPPLTAGDSYEVDSLRYRPSEADLRATDADPPHDRGDSVMPQYLQLPPLSSRVSELARQITEGAPTTYDRARAVDAWLRANVRLGEPAPAGADVVDSVLFASRSGVPVQLATAMVVLLRSAGVPARLAAGFLPGRRGLLRGEYVVRASDAHTWVEAGFGSLGWHRFDPSGLTAKAQREDSLAARLVRFLRRVAPFLAVAGIVAAVLVARWLVLRRRRRAAAPWVSRYWADLTRAGAGAGRPRAPSETPAEYAEALAGSALPDERLAQVGSLVTAAAFSGREPPPEARTWAEDVLDDAVAARRRSRRRRKVPAGT